MDVLTLLTTVSLVIVGLLAGWVAKHFLNLTNAAALVAVLVLPTFFLLLLRGDIAQFGIPGVLQATIAQAGNAPVTADAVAKVDAGSPESRDGPGSRLLDTRDLVGTDAAEIDQRRAAYFGQATNVLLIREEQWRQMTPAERSTRAILIAIVIYNSMIAGSFDALVVTDDENRPIGVFERDYFLDLLRIPLEVTHLSGDLASFNPTNQQIVAGVQQSNLFTILRHPARRADIAGNKAWVAPDTSRLEAMQTMIENRFELLVVVDEKGSYLGIVTLKDLVARTLAEILAAT